MNNVIILVSLYISNIVCQKFQLAPWTWTQNDIDMAGGLLDFQARCSSFDLDLSRLSLAFLPPVVHSTVEGDE